MLICSSTLVDLLYIFRAIYSKVITIIMAFLKPTAIIIVQLQYLGNQKILCLIKITGVTE